MKKAKAVTTNEKKYIPGKEFWMYAVGGLGQGMIYSMMSSYISDFYINVLQVPLLFVLLLMLIARFWDAAYDPFMGAIVDRHTTKWGKMKPYMLFTAIPIAVLTFFMFYAPSNLSVGAKMAYAAVIYVLWGITYSVSDVPFWSLPNAMTPDPSERARTISVGRTLNGIGSAVPMAMFLLLGFIMPRLVDAHGIEMDKKIYTTMAVVCSVIGIALFVNSYFHIKERVVLPDKKRDPTQPSAFSRIIKCKPLMLVIVMGLLSSGRYMMQAAAVHVARYAFYIGPSLEGLSEAAQTAAIKASVSTVSTIFSVCSAVGMFGAMLFMPFLYKRYNYKQIVAQASLPR